MAALSRCMSSPQVTLPHAAHGADSSRRGGQPYSPRFTCCQSVPRLCLCFLSHLPTIRYQFISTPVPDTQSRLKCHSPLIRKALLDLFSSPLLATSGAHCRFTAAPAYYSHRRPISLHHLIHISLSAIAAFVPLPVTTSHRLPSPLRLIQARTQFVPILFKVLLLCFPISSRTDFVVSQLPPLQNIFQTSWARYVLLLCIAFNPFAVSGLRVLSLLLPKLSLSLTPHPSIPHACGRLAKCHPPDTSRLISPNFIF
jgi:hypothetical protein